MGVLALDDRDATIAYSTGWSQAGSSNEFNSTTTFSETVGARAQVTFFGSRIAVYGTIAGSIRNRPTSSYVLDNAAPVNFEGDPTLSVQYNRMFYQSPVLPVASHTLTITNTGDDSPLFLDVLLVTPPDEPMVSTVTTTMTMTMTPPAVTMARTMTVTATVQTTASGSAQADNSSSGATSTGGRSNGGAIAGGIIGALVFILLLAVGFIYYRRRRRQRTDSEPYWVPSKPPSVANNTTPSPPFAPQFQSSAGGPEMNQTNNSGYSSYEPWQTYPTTQTSGQPYPVTTATPYVPPARTPPAGSDLAYYDTSGAYDGYVPEPSPHPPQPAQGQNGRVRVNLND